MLSRNLKSVRGIHKSSSVLKSNQTVTKLENGLTVATIEDNKPVSQLVLAFKAGSRFENSNQAGLTHTIRNFVGRDTQQYFGSSIVWTSAAIGAVLKSFTTRDVFGVALTLPRDQISAGLSILGQAAAVPGFKPWEVEDVYPTMRADNAFRTQFDFVIDGIHKAAYRNSGLANTIFSPCSKIGSISSDALTQFANKHFVSGNAVIFATNAKHEDVELYGKNYSPIRNGSAVTAPKNTYKAGEFRREAETKYAHVIIAGEGAAGNDEKAVATQSVLLAALGNSSPLRFNSGANGVIGKALGENGSASVFQSVHSDSGLAGVYLVADGNGNDVEKSVSSVIGALKQFKVGDLESLKKQAYNNTLNARESSQNFAIEKTAQAFSQTQGDYIDRIAAVSAADVDAAVKKLISNISISSYGNVSSVPYLSSLQ